MPTTTLPQPTRAPPAAPARCRDHDEFRIQTAEANVDPGRSELAGDLGRGGRQCFQQDEAGDGIELCQQVLGGGGGLRI